MLKSSEKQRWKCEVCGDVQIAMVSWSEAWCSRRHTMKKMTLVEGELPAPRKPGRVKSRSVVRKGSKESIIDLLKGVANGK